VADTEDFVVRMVAAATCASSCAYGISSTTAGKIYTVAGTFGSLGSSSGGVPAGSALIGAPTGMLIDPAGNLLFSDQNENRIQMVAAATCASSCAYGLSATTAGDLYNVAGGGSDQSEDVLATSSLLATPTRIGLDAAGDLLIAVQGLNVERIVAKTTCPSSCAFGLSSTTADHI